MKSKFYLTIALTVFLASSLLGKSDFKVLFVNDNSVFLPNTDTMMYALSRTGYDYSVFNARDSLRSPTFSELSAYQLVIWYCSTDGVGNYLWNGNDTDNSELIAYMETGGLVWIIGTDFMYDRYAQAPDTFAAGDFVFDYLGTWQYNYQAYADDGGQGVPELDLVEPGFTSLPIIQWSFPTAWYVDGCTPVPGAVPIYYMGPEAYLLAGFSSAIWYGNSGHTALTFFFDPALMDTDANRIILLEEIISRFLLYSDVKSGNQLHAGLSIYPNPARDFVYLMIPGTMTDHMLLLEVTDISGKSLLKQEEFADQKEIGLNVKALENGIYFLKLSGENTVATSRLIVNR